MFSNIKIFTFDFKSKLSLKIYFKFMNGKLIIIVINYHYIILSFGHVVKAKIYECIIIFPLKYQQVYEWQGHHNYHYIISSFGHVVTPMEV